MCLAGEENLAGDQLEQCIKDAVEIVKAQKWERDPELTLEALYQKLKRLRADQTKI